MQISACLNSWERRDKYRITERASSYLTGLVVLLSSALQLTPAGCRQIIFFLCFVEDAAETFFSLRCMWCTQTEVVCTHTMSAVCSMCKSHAASRPSYSGTVHKPAYRLVPPLNSSLYYEPVFHDSVDCYYNRASFLRINRQLEQISWHLMTITRPFMSLWLSLTLNENVFACKA